MTQLLFIQEINIPEGNQTQKTTANLAGVGYGNTAKPMRVLDLNDISGCAVRAEDNRIKDKALFVFLKDIIR